MSETFMPTEAQKAAAKPWMIGVFVSMGLGILSLALLGVYMYLSEQTNIWIWGLWFCGTVIAVDLGVHFCNKKLAHLADMDPPQLKQHWRYWALIVALWLLMLCWRYSQ